MKKLINQLKESEFTRNVALMFSGNSLAILLPFLLAPLIARLYTPEDFAGFELFVKILMLVSLLGSLRFEQAIIIPKADSESKQLVKLCFKILFGVTFLSAIVVLLANDWIGKVLKNDDLPFLLYFLPAAVLIFGGYNILIQILVRFRKYKVLATNKIFAAGSNNILKYVLGLVQNSSMGLVIGHLVGTLVPGILMLATRASRNFLFHKEAADISQRTLIRKYKDFPLVNSTHVLVDESSKALLFFGISFYFQDVVLGLFAFTFRYLRVPIQVMGTSLAQVLNERMARMRSENQSLTPVVAKTIFYLALIGLIPFGVLFFYGEPIFTFVFSDAWSVAGSYAEIITPWLYLNFMVSPMSMLPIIVNKQKTYLLINTLLQISSLSVLFIRSQMGASPEQVFFEIAMVFAAFHLFMIYWFIRISRSTASSHY
jgi:O-antigen/teichoic acid export membrane protein